MEKMIQQLKPIKLLEILRFFVDFFYPPYCPICHSSLKEEKSIVCENCWKQIPRLDKNYDIVAEIKSKLKGQVYFSQAYSVWHFIGPIQNIIHFLKYQNFRNVTHQMGKFMADMIREFNLPQEQLMLIPVPLHKTRIRERGFNQSLLLCISISSQLNIDYSDKVLVRTRYTQSQTKLNASKRQKNVANAFQVKSAESIRGKTIILVDDVITTGATMNACAQALARCGASEIILISAAKA